MKKITTIAILFLFVLHSNAQNIVPVEKTINYIDARKGIPVGTYLKDVNDLFDTYVGIWKGAIDNKIYIFFITKITENGTSGRFYDKLIIHHLIKDLQGNILEDTRIKSRPHIRGWFFSPNLMYYCLHYSGENSKCGRNGQVSIKKVNATTMLLSLTPWEDVADVRRCPGGIMQEQILPTTTPVTLTKLDETFIKSQLLKNLTLTPKSSSLYLNNGFDNSKIIYPTNINDNIASLLDVFVNADDYSFMANTACANYQSEYKVKMESAHLVSMEKIVSASSCNTPFVAESDYFNFFETDYGVVYSVNIKKNSYVASEIAMFAAQNTSCNYLSSSTKAYLFFDANKPKLFIKNQSCNGTIDLDVTKLEFLFTDTSVNLIKTNTFIVD